MTTKYIVFEAPHTESPLVLPPAFPLIAIITNDFPRFVLDVPCIHNPESNATYTGRAACEAFLQSLVPVTTPEPVIIAGPVVVEEAVVEQPVVVEEAVEEAVEDAVVAVEPAVPAKPQRKRRTTK